MLFSPFVYRVKFQPLPVGNDNDTGDASSRFLAGLEDGPARASKRCRVYGLQA